MSPSTTTRKGPRVGPEAAEALDREAVAAALARFQTAAAQVRNNEEARAITRRVAMLVRQYRIRYGIGIPGDPVSQAMELDPRYVSRPHLDYLAARLVAGVERVEAGENHQMAISMPPRSGKSTLTSLYAPLWMLRRHPEWSIVMTSYDGGLTRGWARQIRHYIEDRPQLGISLQRDGGAGGRWVTDEGGGMYTVGIGGALTGRGARVMIIDDPVSDFVAAHSPRIRQNLWDWWLSVAQTRLEPPWMVLVTMTRWHQDDFVGRLLSAEHEGEAKDWETIRLPALAEGDDQVGRAEGEPLLTPLLVETREQALERWGTVKEAVGSYIFSAMYQQRPSPQKGAIFDVDWWRYWTTDLSRETSDGRVVYLDPDELVNGHWLDSWDAAFKAAEGSGSWVVGQRWVRNLANRYLIAQQRGRWSFTQTLERLKRWSTGEHSVLNPYGGFVHQHLIEEKANGAAIIDTLRNSVSGLKGVNPHVSKEARARMVTPEIESGNVYLPHPSDPGHEWVNDLLSELRNFPHDAYDDQVDALTQALTVLRDPGRGRISVPGNMARPAGVRMDARDRIIAAKTDPSRRRLPGSTNGSSPRR